MKPSNRELSELFIYYPETGVVTWRCGQRKGHNAGWVSKTKRGYLSIRVTIARQIYRLSHVIWCYVSGNWPKEQIDHINGNPLDNRIVNLREVSNSGNQKNAVRRTDNKSGVIGVIWNKKEKRWKSFINDSSNRINLGTFLNISDAISARKSAEVRFCFHPNHGRERLAACQALVRADRR